MNLVMGIQETTSVNEEELRWPKTPSALLIMGKRQGTKRANKQLWGRVAMAAALWHSAPTPKPYLAFVASDVHGRERRHDAEVVKEMLIKRFSIPADFIILRKRSNCTLIEVRAARAIVRTYRLTHVFLITHLYHAPRAQRYANEVLANGSVIPVHSDVLAEVAFPEEQADLRQDILTLIEESQPGWLDRIREVIIEWLLNRAHSLDPRGRLERKLARLLRPMAYR